jgi:DNA-binding transcriptional LysR family regulator
VVKQGRHLALTRNGEILMGYARRLLALNDEAQRALKGELLQGEIRIGMQEDFGESLMPGILGEFKRHHPGLRIIARVDRNPALLTALDDNALDMALLWQPENARAKANFSASASWSGYSIRNWISARCWPRASRCRW